MGRWVLTWVLLTFASHFALCVHVNVDAQMINIIKEMKATVDERSNGMLPLNSVRVGLNGSVLPIKMDFVCSEGYGKAPYVSRRLGNTLDIISQNETVLNMKVRCGEAQFFYPNCTVESTSNLFTGFELQLEGVLLNSDFDITVNLNHFPTCNATLGKVEMVDMSNMSLKFLENKLPKFIADLVAKFLAKYNKKLLDECVVKAVEESIDQLTEKIDLCEIFHPNLRPNDEL